jgi:hypothetical protein
MFDFIVQVIFNVKLSWFSVKECKSCTVYEYVHIYGVLFFCDLVCALPVVVSVVSQLQFLFITVT